MSLGLQSLRLTAVAAVLFGCGPATAGEAPVARACHATAHDPTAGTTLVFGGARQCGVGVLDDRSVWSWDGTAWTRSAEPFPTAREDSQLIVTPDGARLLFGGRNAGTVHQDTWIGDASGWRQAAVSGPGPLEHAAMAHDRTTGKAVLFGGGARQGGSGMSDRTWLWDGRAWSEASGEGPPARVGHSMTGGPDGVYLYGGFNPETSFRDLWRWTREGWTRLHDAGPSATEGGALVHTGEVLVLVGPVGEGAGARMAAWTWDGAAWRDLAGPGPRPVIGQAVVWDTARGAVLIVGGVAQNGQGGPAIQIDMLKDGQWSRPTTAASR